MDHLERGVLAAVSLVDRRPGEWCELWEGIQDSGFRVQDSETKSLFSRDAKRSAPDTAATLLAPEHCVRFTELPWHVDYSATLPLWMDSDEGPAWMSADAITELSDCIRDLLAAAGVRLVAVLCRAVFPAEFNELVEASNKADVLSRITLGLVAAALELIPDSPVEVCCDKHGGRDYYLPVLQSQFEDWIEVRGEGNEASRYRFANDQHQWKIGFYVGGERFFARSIGFDDRQICARNRYAAIQ